MSLAKRLIPIAMLSLLVGCQTYQSPKEIQSPITVKKLPTPPVSIPLSQYTPPQTSQGKMYGVKIIILPSPILDEYIEGNYKVIRAR